MRFPRSRGVVALTAVAISATACTISFGADPTPTGPPEPVSSQAPSPAVQPGIDAPGRLAIVRSDGALVTMDADGSSAVEIVAGGQPSATATQPAWSPDGTHLAWVSYDATAGRQGGSIMVAGPGGEDAVSTPAPFVPYYLSWDPTGRRIAFLGQGTDPNRPVEMGLLDVSGGRSPRRVTAGSPFLYFSWGPDGQELLVHTGFDTLERIDLTGDGTPVSQRPGLFSTPAWSDDGRTVVYAERGPDQVQRLVARRGSRPPRVLAEGTGALTFVLRPDGGAVAYQFLGEPPGGQEPPGGAVGYRFLAPAPGEGARGRVQVVDLRTGSVRAASLQPALTFWWSPRDDTLLSLIPSLAGPGRVRFGWQVFDGRVPRPLPGFHIPTQEVLQDYAPFFTQYAQSTTPWSPDGSAIAFPTVGPDGTGQVVVEPIDGAPVIVAPGVSVTWSP